MITTHTYYASTINVPTTVLIGEAIRDARNTYGNSTRWVLDMVDEYHTEVLDDEGKKVVDVEAKVVVRQVQQP